MTGCELNQAYYTGVLDKLDSLAAETQETGVNQDLAERLKGFADEIRSDLDADRRKGPTVRSAWLPNVWPRGTLGG